ncbi:MAG: glycosyltransferase family 2 protein [Lachnospiraceae bacterium]|nr:glycosyltransferase family 2 protein [Lachnospiraceae bacterium]
MKSEYPKIAIFMSCYNHEKYVGEAIDCIIRQTYPHWELFVANDGSTDRSAEVIASYHDARIHFYDLKKNTKYAGASEMLYDIIKPLDFDYVQSMSSDDLLDIHKLEKQITFFKEHPQYVACFTWDKLLFDDGAGDYPEDYSHVKNRSRYNWLNRFYSFGNCLNSDSALIRKDVFYEMDTLNQRYYGIADFRLWCMIAAKYPIYLIQEELCVYRRHASNISSIDLGGIMNYYQEKARLLTDLIGGMSRETFVRSFYPHLAYKQYRNACDIAAAKVFMLAGGNIPERQQAAINLYFEYCSDRSVTGVLEEKYGFTNDDFNHLKENGGLTYAANMVMSEEEGEDYIPHKAMRAYHPGRILLDAIKNKTIGFASVGDYTYATLWSLNMLYDKGEGYATQFQNAKMFLQKLRCLWRESLAERKVLFIVSSESKWHLNRKNTPILPDKKTRFYITYVNPEEVLRTKELQGLVERDKNEITDIALESHISLSDPANQSLLFADEVISNLTDVCYVDCLNGDYECYDMVLGFSLRCSQIAIMDKKTYEYMAGDDPDMLRMMDSIYCY